MNRLKFNAKVAALTLPICLGIPAATAAPASATPPQAEEIATLAWIFPDTDNNLIGFLNISRADFCAWVGAGGEEPPPFVDPLSPAWVHERGDGGIGAVAIDDLYLELWRLDEGATPDDACADTDDSDAPIATGTTRMVAVDHLFEINEHGALGAQWNGTSRLTAPDGTAYKYQFFTLELHDPRGNVRHDDTLRSTLIELH
jgi:hypothetical protein